MKMEPTVSSETSAIRTQAPANYPKGNKLQYFRTSKKNDCTNNIQKKPILTSQRTQFIPIIKTIHLTFFREIIRSYCENNISSSIQKKKPATCNPKARKGALKTPPLAPCPEPDKFSSHPSYHFFKMRFNIILPLSPRYSKWSLLQIFSPKLCTFRLPPHA